MDDTHNRYWSGAWREIRMVERSENQLMSGPPVSQQEESAAGDGQQPGRADGRPEFVRQRLLSLDAYRGLIMISLAFYGFGLRQTSQRHLEQLADLHGEHTSAHAFWKLVQYHFSHVTWAGCGFWDMIQPSFMFMVGVSMAYSCAKRQRMGQSSGRMLGHAMWRSLVLVLLGVFLSSKGAESTNWSFTNVLTQIGLGYTFLFLLWGRTFSVQAIAATAVLIGTWLLYMLYPGAGIDLTSGAPDVGVTREWAQQHLTGVGPAWHKNANIGFALDRWLLNLFPRKEPFQYQPAGYPTLNFLPSLATMIFGMMCGELLRCGRSDRRKLLLLLVAGAGGLAVGQILNMTGICPLVKKIWTPGWAIFSTGLCCLILAALYAIVDVLKIRLWTYPLVVVSVNSIAIYCMSILLGEWVSHRLRVHLGWDLYKIFGEVNAQAVGSTMVGMVFWLLCLWMFQKKIFIRI